MSKEVMTRVLDALRNHTEKGGRNVSELFKELPSRKMYPDYFKIIKHPVAIDTIQANVDGGCSLASFVAEVNLMITNAKTYNEPGSQVFKDASTLLHVFETAYDRETTRLEMSPTIVENVSSFAVGGVTYHNGNYVYIKNHSEPEKPMIGQITSMFLDSNKEYFFTANWYLRLEQTFHKASAKFMEKELLKSNRSETYSASDIAGRCWVLFVKDYVRGYPRETDPKMQDHVYVCETRYNDYGKSSSRIKQWHEKTSDDSLILYDTPIVPVKVASVFATIEDAKKRRIPEDDFIDVDDEDDEREMEKVAAEKKAAEKKEKAAKKEIEKEKAVKVDQAVAAEEKKPRSSRRGSVSAAPVDEPPPPAVMVNTYESPSQSQAQPQQRLQTAAREMNAETNSHLEAFDCYPNGELKWYSSMPIDSAPRNVLLPSLEYLEWSQKRARVENTGKPEETSQQQQSPKRIKHSAVRANISKAFDVMASSMLSAALMAMSELH